MGCLALPPPGDLPDPGIKPASLMPPALAGGFFTTSITWEALEILGYILSTMRSYLMFLSKQLAFLSYVLERILEEGCITGAGKVFSITGQRENIWGFAGQMGCHKYYRKFI